MLSDRERKEEKFRELLALEDAAYLEALLYVAKSFSKDWVIQSIEQELDNRD